MNVLLYAKAKASNDKRDRKHNVEARLRALRHFAAGHGWTVVGEFSDKPLNAWDDRRGFTRLFARVLMGGVQAIVVQSPDQLGLSPRQLMPLADELFDRDVCIISTREGTDLGAPLRNCVRRGADLLALAYRIGRGDW